MGGLALQPDAHRSRGLSRAWGPLGPVAVFPPKVYPPPVGYFPEEAIHHFAIQLDESTVPAARARISDFLWLRRHEIAHADTAVDEYTRAAPAVFDARHGPTTGLDYLARAKDLIRSLGRDEGRLTPVLYELVNEHLTHQLWGMVCSIVRHGHAQLAGDDARARELLRLLISRGEEYGQSGGQERFMERDLFQEAAKLAHDLGEQSLASDLRRRVPRSLENEAIDRAAEGGLIESIFLQDALRGYSDLGMSEDVERLKPAVHRATERAGEEMTEVSAEVAVPREKVVEEVEKLLETSRPKSDWHHLYPLGCSRGLWPSWNEVMDREEQYAREFPLQTLVRKELITADGRPLPRPEETEAARLFNQIGRFIQEQRIALMLTQVRVQILRERRAWSADLIRSALAEGALFSDPVLRAVTPGLEAFENGRHWEALHVLVFQIERVIRQLGQQIGAETFSYDVGKGYLRWTSLDVMLENPAMAAVLATVRDDWPQELKYTLVDPRGWNLRNSVGHGITTVDDDLEASSLMAILILLCLSTLRLAENAEPAS